MEWIRMHPYTSAVLAVCLVVFFGVILVNQKSAVSSDSSSIIAWGGGGDGFFNTPLGSKPAEIEERRDLFQAVQNTAPFSYIPFRNTSQSLIETEEQDAELAEVLKFLSGAISGNETGNINPTTEGSGFDVYSFIPRGLIATTSTRAIRTSTQNELYGYGNDAGFIIMTFEDTNEGMSRVLKDQAEDPTNAEKNQRLQDLAEDMIRVGEDLEALNRVPQIAVAANKALAKSYKEMGAKLALISGVSGDDARIEAMLSYNTTVESFVKNFVNVATLFSAAGVTFQQFDGGSVFTFSAGTSF